MNAVGEEPNENRESRDKDPLLSQLYSQQSFNLRSTLRTQPCATSLSQTFRADVVIGIAQSRFGSVND